MDVFGIQYLVNVFGIRQVPLEREMKVVWVRVEHW